MYLILALLQDPPEKKHGLNRRRREMMAHSRPSKERERAGRVVEQDRLVILFRWMQRPEIFGAIYDLTDYRSTFGTATGDFLAGNIVSNDLAGHAWPQCHVGRRLG